MPACPPGPACSAVWTVCQSHAQAEAVAEAYAGMGVKTTVDGCNVMVVGIVKGRGKELVEARVEVDPEAKSGHAVKRGMKNSAIQCPC